MLLDSWVLLPLTFVYLHTHNKCYRFIDHYAWKLKLFPYCYKRHTIVASQASFADTIVGCDFSRSWTMPEYKCYWRAVSPDTKVAVIFGMPAAQRYGTDLTLWQGLQGRGDPYRTLLREGITAFLNSYNSLQYTYNTIEVVQQMNSGLMGSKRNVLYTALRFIRANSGHGKVPCKFTACK